MVPLRLHQAVPAEVLGRRRRTGRRPAAPRPSPRRSARRAAARRRTSRRSGPSAARRRGRPSARRSGEPSRPASRADCAAQACTRSRSQLAASAERDRERRPQTVHHVTAEQQRDAQPRLLAAPPAGSPRSCRPVEQAAVSGRGIGAVGVDAGPDLPGRDLVVVPSGSRSDARCSWPAFSATVISASSRCDLVRPRASAGSSHGRADRGRPSSGLDLHDRLARPVHVGGPRCGPRLHPSR